MFARSVVDGYSLLLQSSALTIAKAIQGQLSGFRAHTLQSTDNDTFFSSAPAQPADDGIWSSSQNTFLRSATSALGGPAVFCFASYHARGFIRFVTSAFIRLFLFRPPTLYRIDIHTNPLIPWAL